MAFKIKPLVQDQYSIKIIEDLGIRLSPTGARTARYATVECEACKSHFMLRMGSTKAKQQTKCIDCGNSKHNLSSHPLYSIWNGIKQRCYNPSRKDYSKYGEKGVTMYEDWIDSPTKFIEWCENNGWYAGCEIDKDIKSNLLSIYPPIYSPETLSFVTQEENAGAANNKAVEQYTLDGMLLGSYESCTKAAIALGKPKQSKSSIANCCRGTTHTAFGFKWKFKT